MTDSKVLTKRVWLPEDKVTILNRADKEGYSKIASEKNLDVRTLYSWKKQYPSYQRMFRVWEQLEAVDVQLSLNRTISKGLSTEVERAREDQAMPLNLYNASTTAVNIANVFSRLVEKQAALEAEWNSFLNPEEESGEQATAEETKDDITKKLLMKEAKEQTLLELDRIKSEKRRRAQQVALEEQQKQLEALKQHAGS
jgi:hypothetical protein